MYCPQCGQPYLHHSQHHEYLCPCGFHYFQNVAAAGAAILCHGDEILVTRRARNPGRGLLDFPGGFVDPGETLEQALQRELEEELGLKVDISDMKWLGSRANIYPYDGVTYHTCDSYFQIRLPNKPKLVCQDDVIDYEWRTLNSIDPDEFAFASSKSILLVLNRAYP